MSEVSKSELLMAQAARGDRRALERLLLGHHARLLAFVAARLPARLRGVVEVDDIVHKTYVKVFSRIETFEGQSEPVFFAWLKTIALNQLADELKRRSRQRLQSGRAKTPSQESQTSWVGTLVENVAASNTTPSRCVSREESIRAMHVALASLSDDYRRVIWLHCLQELPMERVAEELGCSPGAARGLCYRAKQKLRDALGHASSYFTR